MLVPSKSLASTVVLRHPPSASTDSHAKFLSHWIDPSVPRWLAFISHNLLENVLMISSLFWAEPEVPDLLRRSGCQRVGEGGGLVNVNNFAHFWPFNVIISQRAHWNLSFSVNFRRRDLIFISDLS